MECKCGIPSEANYYTRVIYSVSYFGRDHNTTYHDRYTCDEHTPPLDNWSAETSSSDPDVEGVGRLLGIPSTKGLKVFEVTQTELR